ncbi:TPM domain-containing protein [Ancylobacter sp. VNQ12]|uniref:TPM domain-containing protein n=1 Tax=Ancylobacter sp. VNQ12 TaxID=3400920 RepID=UPI003C088D9C
MRLLPLRQAGFRAGLILLFLVGALAGAARAELDFPELTGRVVDAAGILDAAQRAALDTKLAAQEASVTDQFVVATVPSLDGTSVEDYANRLFRHWQIGQKDKDNGVLLLVAPNERKVRIEVGYGLEGVLPDAVASTIVQTAILPAFRAGDYPAGIDKGADAIIEILNLDPVEAEARARRAADPPLTAEDWIALLFFAAMFVFFIYVFYRQVRYGRSRTARRGKGAAAAGGVSSWEWGSGSSGGGWSSGGGGGWSGGGGSSGGGGASGSW